MALNSVKAKDETLGLLSRRNILKYVQDLNLNGWSKLTNSGLEVVFFFSLQHNTGHCKVL
jgi:hypothetical protein